MVRMDVCQNYHLDVLHFIEMNERINDAVDALLRKAVSGKHF